jgi:hypothetical protein
MALAEKRHFFLNVLVYKLFISVSTHDWTGPLTGLVPYTGISVYGSPNNLARKVLEAAMI